MKKCEIKTKNSSMMGFIKKMVCVATLGLLVSGCLFVPVFVQAEEINVELTPEQLEQLQREFENIEEEAEAEVTGELREGMDEEFSEQEREGIFLVEEIERLRSEAKRSKIWGGIILVLVCGIFGVGIFSVIRESRKEDVTDGQNQSKNATADKAKT